MNLGLLGSSHYCFRIYGCPRVRSVVMGLVTQDVIFRRSDLSDYAD